MDFKNFLNIFDYEIDEKALLKLSNDYFLVNEKLKETMKKNSEKPKSAGIFLGTEKNKEFKPSLALIDMISKKTDKKIFIDKNSEWLFLCKRDIMGQSVLKPNNQKGIVLVQDKDDNNLGMARITDPRPEKDKVYAKNILDLGDYLRREKR